MTNKIICINSYTLIRSILSQTYIVLKKFWRWILISVQSLIWQDISTIFKGQLISKCLLNVLNSPKKQTWKGEGESVLCEGIWNGNLQFCPKWLSKGLYKLEIWCLIKWDAQNQNQVFWRVFNKFLMKFHTFIDIFQ